MSIMADENGPVSCHGLLKHEGTYDGGFFKAVKIYRMFNANNARLEDEELETEFETNSDPYQTFKTGWTVTYTRCKGVPRTTADNLPDLSFDPADPSRTLVHRTALRPARTGEMLLKAEARSLAVPFNFKRRVCERGLHTVCFSSSSSS